jgi:Protein of unknown function (DUF5818)
MRKMLTLALATAALSFGAAFTGVITDSMCDNADHKDMKMGADPKCVVECVKGMGGKYVLYDAASKTTYKLSDQKAPEKFAAKKVTVTGTLDDQTKTITVQSIEAAK